MTTRATKEIVITSEGVEHKVLVYTFLNGFEKQEMTKIMTAKTNVQGGDVDIQGGDVMQAYEYLIKALVCSLDGDTNDVYNRLMILHSDVYDAVFAEIGSIMNEWGKKKVA
jgi:hypothetical protein